jgi:hypothetical protein
VFWRVQSGVHSKPFFIKPSKDFRFKSMININITADNPDVIIEPSKIRIMVGDLYASFTIGIPNNMTGGSFTVSFSSAEFGTKYQDIGSILCTVAKQPIPIFLPSYVPINIGANTLDIHVYTTQAPLDSVQVIMKLSGY